MKIELEINMCLVTSHGEDGESLTGKCDMRRLPSGHRAIRIDELEKGVGHTPVNLDIEHVFKKHANLSCCYKESSPTLHLPVAIEMAIEMLTTMKSANSG